MTIEDYNISIIYSFASALGDIEEYRYLKTVTAAIFGGENADNQIGELKFTIIYLEKAIDEGFDIYQLFDTYEYTFRLGELFFDFKNEDYKAAIHQHYGQLLFTESFCIIESMSLLPAYRGKNIGQQLFKDIVHNFGQECTLFILQPFPLQFDVSREEEEQKKLQLFNLEKIEAKAFKKLTTLYESWGFEKIKGIKELLFYNTELR